MVAKYAGGVRVAVTGASESGVFRWTAAETVLSVDFLADALDCLSLNGDGMITDVHGSGAYRAHLVKIMTGRAVKAAA
jgi:carbon-monoxide dehydrogenase medium subunit